jgi:hypothetical protein
MPTVTRTQLREDAAKLMGLLLHTGTASGGSTTGLTDTGSGGLRDTGMSTYLFEGSFLHITDTTDDAAPTGEWRMITPTGFDPTANTLQVTVGEAFTATVDSGDTYEIIASLDPDQWSDIIDDVLTQRMRHKWRTPLSLVDDPDMEADNTTSWTGTNATVTKVTNSNVLEGVRSVRVANSSAAGYAQSTSVNVNPGDSLNAWADYRAVSGTAVLRAYDVTNSASIASDSGTDGGDNRAGGGIHLSFSAPATCRQVALRLEGTESTADIYWENVALLNSGRRYALPSWVEERDQIIGIEHRVGSRPNDYQFPSVGYPEDIEEGLTGQQPFRVVLPQTGGGPYFVYGYRKYAALTSESATTSAPLEWAKYEVASAAYERLGDNWRPRTKGYVQPELVEKRLHSLRQLNQPRQVTPVGGRRPWVYSRGFTW